MAKRTRSIQLLFRVTEQERDLIHEKMTRFGIRNMEAYLRKMAIDGMVIQLDLPELTGIASLLRRCGNNLNQIARHANETGRLYEADMEGVFQMQQALWRALNDLLARLAALT